MVNSLLEIGKIVNTHGVRGEVKIQPWCDDPGLFEELEYFYADGKRYDIRSVRFHKQSILAYLDGVNSMEQAELLKNKILTIEREALGELPEGVYYICDLLGLEVKKEDGTTLGKIDEVLKTGSNDVYVLETEDKKPLLIPVLDDVVKEVNIKDGYVIVCPPKGLIDNEN